MSPVPVLPNALPRQGGPDCSEALDIMIVMDDSSSIGQRSFDQMKSFVEQLVTTFQNDNTATRIGLITFDDAPRLIEGLTDDADTVAAALDRVFYTDDGGTSITNALQMANGQLRRDIRNDTPRVIIIFTDGGDGGTPQNLMTAVNELQTEGVQLIVVAVGDQISQEQITSMNPVATISVSGFNELSASLDTLTQATCIDAVIASTTDNSSTTTLNTSAGIPANDDGSSALITDVLPFALAGLVLLLFLAGLLSLFRRRDRQDTAFTQRSIPEEPRQQPKITKDYSGWVRRIDKKSLGQPAPKFAEIHTKTLVVGLGVAGANALQRIVERVDDTNTSSSVYYAPKARAYDKTQLDARNLALLHIDIPSIYSRDQPATAVKFKERWRENLVDYLAIHGTPDDDSPSEAQAEWATLMHARSSKTLTRQTAKLAMFNAFRLGKRGGALDTFTFLEDYIKAGFYNIFLIASPFDWVGANIVGDIALLLRAVEPDRTNTTIYTFLLLDDKNRSTIARYNTELMRSTALHELGRLSTPAGIKLKTDLGPGISHTLEREREAMIDGMVLFPGQTSQHRLNNFVWGLLVSNKLFSEFTARNSNIRPQDEYVPSVSVSMTHSIEWPMTLLRELLVCQLMIDLIGPTQTPRRKDNRRIPCEIAEIDIALDEVRGLGLLPSILMLQEQSQCDNLNFLNDLRHMLERQRDNYEYRRRDISNQLQQIYRTSNDRTVAFRPEEWDNERYNEKILEDMFDIVGWAARISPNDLRQGYLVRMLFAPNLEKSYYDVEELDQYVFDVEDLARNHIVNDMLAPNKDSRLAELGRRRFQNTSEKWGNQYNAWFSELNDLLDSEALQDAFRFSYNAPLDWTRNPTEDLGIHPHEDSTFALQGSLYSRVPLKLFKSLRVTTGLQDFVHPTEAIVSDVFSDHSDALKHVPVPLQSALTQRTAFWAFYQAWRVEGKRAMIEALDLRPKRDDSHNTDATSMSFEQALKSFLHDYADNYRKLQNATADYIETAEDVNDNPTEVFASDFDETIAFDKYLKIAFRTLTTGGSRYFPPNRI